MRGFLVLDKPAGITSSRLLSPLRRCVGRRVKVGHAGTLDPFATGTLLALLGDVTRLSDLAMALPKCYETTIRFGRETDTLDPEGAVVREADPGPAPPARLDGALERFVGEIEQTPPAYSAVKVAGTPAYRLARRGAPLQLASRRVTVHSIERIGLHWPRLTVRIRCGAGTYVRSIARDLGVVLGLPASLESLRRTEIGPFHADDGLALAPGERLDDERLAAALRDPIELIEASALPIVELPREAATRVARGNPAPLPPGATAGPVGSTIAVVTAQPQSGAPLLVGLGRIEPDRCVRGVTVLSHARSRLEELTPSRADLETGPSTERDR